ncbi:PDZ domain-containing protein, partial [Thiolapillus sp.]
PQGALVARVIKDSPAAKGGLRVGDVILMFNDQLLRNSSQLPPLVGTMAVGEDARLKVLRNGKEIELTVRIAELPSEEAQEQPEEAAAPDAAKSNRLGLVFSELTAEERKKLELSNDEGVRVEEVHEGPAASAGVDPGDVVLMVDGRKISSLAQLQQIIKAVLKGKTVAMLLLKPQGPVFVALRAPD